VNRASSPSLLRADRITFPEVLLHLTKVSEQFPRGHRELLVTVTHRGPVEHRHIARLELDAPSPAIRIPLERPLYAPVEKTRIDSEQVRNADEETDPGALFEQVYVDPGPLRVVPPGFVIGHGSEVRGRSACLDRLVAGTMGA
jgi:hypothetical protein